MWWLAMAIDLSRCGWWSPKSGQNGKKRNLDCEKRGGSDQILISLPSLCAPRAISERKFEFSLSLSYRGGHLDLTRCAKNRRWGSVSGGVYALGEASKGRLLGGKRSGVVIG